VRATGGTLSGDVQAAGNVTSVTAATINGSRILAGCAGAANRVVGAVAAGDGGIQNGEIRATGRVTTVTAGAGGITDTHISAGLAPGGNGVYETSDDTVLRGVISMVSTSGRLEDVVIIAGVGPGRDDEYGQHALTAANATDNAAVAGSTMTTVTATGGYKGDVRLITGSRALGAYTLGGVRLTTSATYADGNGNHYLTLIRTVNGVSTVV
jgi:hypothetical protein